MYDAVEQVECTMQERYEAARAISAITGGEVKDTYWNTWKKSIHTALDALIAEISNFVQPMGLNVQCCFAYGHAGATLYLEAPANGSNWQPTNNYWGPPQVPPALPESPPFVWNPREISPGNASAFQALWVNRGKPPLTEKQVVAMKIAKPQPIVTSATVVPVCSLPLFTIGYVAHPHTITPTALVKRHPYVTTYMCRHHYAFLI